MAKIRWRLVAGLMAFGATVILTVPAIGSVGTRQPNSSGAVSRPNLGAAQADVIWPNGAAAGDPIIWPNGAAPADPIIWPNGVVVGDSSGG